MITSAVTVATCVFEERHVAMDVMSEDEPPSVVVAVSVAVDVRLNETVFWLTDSAGAGAVGGDDSHPAAVKSTPIIASRTALLIWLSSLEAPAACSIAIVRPESCSVKQGDLMI